MKDKGRKRKGISRRGFLKGGVAGVAGAAGLAGLYGPQLSRSRAAVPPQSNHDPQSMGAVGRVDHEGNGFDPHELLYDFDYGEVVEEDGRTVRRWRIVAMDRELEVAPGVFFPGWVYGSETSAASRRRGGVVGQCPGPTLRCVEGERLELEFVNASSHEHTMHFHGIHHARMDGVPGTGPGGNVGPGESFTYEFEAQPFGCHLYHCHSIPLKRHIHKGLYGAFIVDPDPGLVDGELQRVARSRHHRSPENADVNEMVMVMNGFDTNFDGDNEIYAVNSIAFAYGMDSPIPIRADQLQRVYLINTTEFDPINSFHLHANFFDYYDHGTTLTPTLKTVDTIMQCQAQRGILEFSFRDFEPGMYMFHAHQSEFAELGWMGFFQVEV